MKNKTQKYYVSITDCKKCKYYLANKVRCHYPSKKYKYIIQKDLPVDEETWECPLKKGS